jgi:adenylate cyclase
MSGGIGRIERRLAALFCADVAGYSRLMATDEIGTMRTLMAHRRRMDSLIARHGGRIANTAGDSVLAEFPSVVDAIECAAAVQDELAAANVAVPDDRALRFRVGVHVGDVMVRGADLLGDGVNVAARVQALAHPGGVWISEDAHRHCDGKLDRAFADRGEQHLKNIPRALRVYELSATGSAEKERRPLALPDKPSIAVLPFTNMSPDIEQEYFADGVVEDIITALSKFQGLFVIARNSTFTYKGRAVDIKRIGAELGVRYVLEGSVRKGGNRVRITGQLIDATKGALFWADRVDGSIEDVFELLDRVTAEVVCAIIPTVEQAEIDRARRKPTESLDSYDYYLRGVASLYKGTADKLDEARRLFESAIERDPEFAAAYGRAAMSVMLHQPNHQVGLSDANRMEALRLAYKALELGGNDAVALGQGAHVIAYLGRDYARAVPAADRAVTINPNLLIAVRSRAWVRLMAGEPERALQDFGIALRLNPLDPSISSAWYGCAFACFHLDRHEEGYAWAKKAVQDRPTFTHALAAFAVNARALGRRSEAEAAVETLCRLLPDLRVAHLRKLFPVRATDEARKIEDSLRSLGLPE